MAFDTHNEIASRIRRESGWHEVVVRWPTDPEWVEYRRGVTISLHHLGRGISEGKAETAVADLRLYDKIKLEGSPDLTLDEAEKMIGDVARCEITGCVLSADDAVVDMIVCGGEKVQHTLRIPTTAETMQFKRGHSRGLTLPHGRQQLKTNLQVGADLWEKCQRGTTGYANGHVPVLHQDAAVVAVISECDRESEVLAEEDF